MKPVYQIREYGSFITGKKTDGYVTLPETSFLQLENFLLSRRNRETDALELMGISIRKGIGKVITAKNYVGVLMMKDGTTIEILPKVSSTISKDESGERSKRLLIEMLKTLWNTPYKTLQTANVHIERMSVFEVFVRMFVDEIFFIVKRGLKRSYETVEENAAFFKGKMKFSQQIKFNHTHKERSYMEYDVFNCNGPENRLIKATLQLLIRQSTSLKNRNDLKILLNAFGGVEASTDFTGDFSRCAPDRTMKDYSTALPWCRVFLTGKSFTSFSGSEVALALLFPMETLFESYVAAQLRKKLAGTDFTISIQDKSYHLFDTPQSFQLKPDIVVTRKSDRAVFVLDTKWKLLTPRKTNYGIAQPDIYQMFAYQKRYRAEHVTLLYPMTELLPSDKNISFSSSDGVIVKAHQIDLFDMPNSIASIVNGLHCAREC